MTARAFHVRLFLAGLALVLVAGAERAATQDGAKTIFVSVIDEKGKPVTDMTATDFAIREDNVDREVVSVKKSEQPMAIALMIDTSTGTQDFVQDIRAAATAFITQIHAGSPESEIALWEFGQASIEIEGFTDDSEKLLKQAARLFPKQRASSVLLEGLLDTSRALARQKTPRRAIAVINIEPSTEVSSQQPNRVLQAFVEARTQFWAVSIQKGALENAQRDVVLNRFVQVGGGRREYVVTQSAAPPLMADYANAMVNQYEVTYTRPSGKPQVVMVGTARSGVKLIAGIAAPQ
jgi:hypothetical protein